MAANTRLDGAAASVSVVSDAAVPVSARSLIVPDATSSHAYSETSRNQATPLLSMP